jgi:poly(3-hydroxybutyrate) depolymerase
LDIINSISSRYCISPNKIFASGKSNGGGFTNILACDPEASSIIAAFAPVAGAFYLGKGENPLPCKPSRVTPILEFHGLQDTTVPYLGGSNSRANGEFPPIPKWLDGWAERDRCTGKRKTTILCGDGDKKVTRSSWDCKGIDDAVGHYKFANLHHVWPSKDGNDDGDITTCFDATPVIIDWFAKHPLP